MRIVEMTGEHVPQIAGLEQLCFSDPWSERSIASEMDNDLALWLVALEGQTAVGYVGSQTVLGETDMMNLAVHPDFRRKGIAASLVRELVQRLKDRGSRCLTLEVRASNQPAQALYTSLGFAQVGRRPNYYQHPKEDGLILRKEWEL